MQQCANTAARSGACDRKCLTCTVYTLYLPVMFTHRSISISVLILICICPDTFNCHVEMTSTSVSTFLIATVTFLSYKLPYLICLIIFNSNVYIFLFFMFHGCNSNVIFYFMHPCIYILNTETCKCFCSFFLFPYALAMCMSPPMPFKLS